MAREGANGVAAWEDRRVTTPRAAGIAGLLFAILFSTSVILIRASMGTVSDTGEWLANGARWFSFAIGLMPFAGIFFLWFIGVARARLGRFEDQFFSTVFFGSGLLFLAMVFVAAGIGAGIVAGYSRDPEGFATSTAYYFARDLVVQLFSIYALRMAAVFLFSQATLWVRTRVMPLWLSIVTFLVGLVLLFVYTRSFWVVLLFPAWVFLVSSYLLIASSLRRPAAGAAGSAEGEPGETGAEVKP